jgi:hypothetical protein
MKEIILIISLLFSVSPADGIDPYSDMITYIEKNHKHYYQESAWLPSNISSVFAFDPRKGEYLIIPEFSNERLHILQGKLNSFMVLEWRVHYRFN